MSLSALILSCSLNVAPQTMFGIIGEESGARAIAIGYKVVTPQGREMRLTAQPANIQEAQSWARWMLVNGYKFDAGIAQVNSTNFRTYGLTPENVFDACKNISAGAQILQACYRQALPQFKREQTALHAALSCYQSGNFRTGFKTGYVSRVIRKANAAPPYLTNTK